MFQSVLKVFTTYRFLLRVHVSATSYSLIGGGDSELLTNYSTVGVAPSDPCGIPFSDTQKLSFTEPRVVTVTDESITNDSPRDRILGNLGVLGQMM